MPARAHGSMLRHAARCDRWDLAPDDATTRVIIYTVQTDRKHMPTHRIIASLLHNFLGTYTSRYTEYGDRWLFGYLDETSLPMVVDLLGAPGAVDTPTRAVSTLAVDRFLDQMSKAGLAPADLADARMVIERLPGEPTGWLYGRMRSGMYVSFHVQATSARGRRYERRCTLFVVPNRTITDAREERGG